MTPAVRRMACHCESVFNRIGCNLQHSEETDSNEKAPTT